MTRHKLVVSIISCVATMLLSVGVVGCSACSSINPQAVSKASESASQEVSEDASQSESASAVEAEDVAAATSAGDMQVQEPKPEPEIAANDGQPFWGVWAFEAGDLSSTSDFLEQVESAGGQPQVFLTSDWSNLNQDPWYAVAYSTAATEEDAEQLRDQAVAAGFADAYVKFSGRYLPSDEGAVVEAVEGYMAKVNLPQSVTSFVEFRQPDQDVITAWIGNTKLFEIYTLYTPGQLPSNKEVSESRMKVYYLGYAADGFQALQMRVELYYLAPDGSGNAYWGDDGANDLAFEKLTGLTESNLLAGIELRNMKPNDVVNTVNPVVKWKAPDEVTLISDDAAIAVEDDALEDEGETDEADSENHNARYVGLHAGWAGASDSAIEALYRDKAQELVADFGWPASGDDGQGVSAYGVAFARLMDFGAGDYLVTVARVVSDDGSKPLTFRLDIWGYDLGSGSIANLLSKDVAISVSFKEDAGRYLLADVEDDPDYQADDAGDVQAYLLRTAAEDGSFQVTSELVRIVSAERDPETYSRLPDKFIVEGQEASQAEWDEAMAQRNANLETFYFMGDVGRVDLVGSMTQQTADFLQELGLSAS